MIFENEESAEKACYEPKQNIGGRDVDIKKAQPQNIQKQNQRRNHLNISGFGFNNYGGGGSVNSYGNEGYGNNWRGDRSGGYRQNNNSNYQNNGGYQKRGPRPGGFNMNPAESSTYYNNYNRQPDYM